MSTRRQGSVFLLTDYGGADEFAGVVRAVVARHAPGAPIVDLSHDVPPFDVRAGALALERAAPYLGHGIVLAVVDPGVGSARRGVAVTRGAKDGPSHFVGPDNGLLPWALDALGGAVRAVELTSGANVAATDWANDAGRAPKTFDGRDLFAPVAAQLWCGAAPATVGTPIEVDSLVRLARPHLLVAPGTVEAEVQWIDRFGNAQLAARPDHIRAAGLSRTLDTVIGSAVHRMEMVAAFAELATDAPGLVADANGHLALVVNRGSAADLLDVHVGDVVVLRPGMASTVSRP